MALLLSASSGSQRPSRFASFAPIGLAGAVTALLWKKQQAAKPGPYGYLPAQPYGNSGPETARIGGQACLGPQRVRRQLVAMKQPNGGERLTAPGLPLIDHFAKRLRNKQTAARRKV